MPIRKIPTPAKSAVPRLRSILGIVILLYGGAISLAQSAPPDSQAERPFPPPELSSIAIPVEIPLRPLTMAIEAQVPRVLDSGKGYQMEPKKRFGYRYRLQRDPVTLFMKGTGLHLMTNVHYAIEGCVRAANPLGAGVAMWPCVSCGLGEPMRVASIALHSHLTFEPSWNLRSTTVAPRTNFPNPCGVTILSIDISRRFLAPLVDDQLKQLARSIDQNTPTMTSFRKEAAQLWAELQEPIEVSPNSWMTISPFNVALGPIHESGRAGFATGMLMLDSFIRISIGQRPPAGAVPFPPLHAGNGTQPGLHIPVDVQVPYAEADRILSERLAGQVLATPDGTVAILSIALKPGSRGTLAIDAEVDYKAARLRSYRGPVTLEGIPSVDPATNELHLTAIEYSLESSRENLFLKLADRFAHGAIRSRLEQGAHWSFDTEVAAMRVQLEQALSRTLSRGVTMEGHIKDIRPLSVTARPDGLVIRALASGTASVAVSDWDAMR